MGIDYERLYEYRCRNVDQSAREAVWKPIAESIYQKLGRPERLLDPAAGRGEFIQAAAAPERWAVDLVDYGTAWEDGVRHIVGDVMTVDLPPDYFGGVLVSNFLEHLVSADDVAVFLDRLRACMAPGGRVAVLGPNFRYLHRSYFDCADHVLPLTHISVAEHLYAAGFELDSITSRFLPYSFRGHLPTHPALVRAYLRVPIAWRVFGRQYLVVARAPGGSA